MLNDTTTESGKTLTELEAMANDPRFSEVTASSTVEKETTVAKEPGSMQEAVQQALDAREDAETETDSTSVENASEEKETPETGEPVEEEGKKEEPTPEQQAEVDEKIKKENERLDKNPRFQEVLKERNELKPLADAAKFDNDFCTKWNIAPTQKAEAMNLMALINSDPKKGLEMLKKVVEQMELQTGAKLPADLQKRVDDSLISAEDAMELHKSRLQNQTFKQQQQEQEKRFVQQQQQQVTQALGQWGLAKQRLDPGFKPKSNDNSLDGKFEQVTDRILVLQQKSGKLNFSPAEATAMAEDAYNYVQQLYSRLQPAQRARRTIQNNGSSSEQNGKEPNSMLEAVQKAIGRKHGLRLTNE